MADDDIKLLETCFDSYAPYASEELEAYFKATKDLHLDGLPKRYFSDSMTRMQGNRYLVHGYKCAEEDAESYSVGVDTLTAERLKLDDPFNIDKSFVEGRYMLLLQFIQYMVILKDLQVIGKIYFKAKRKNCKNGHPILGRYAQQAGHSVYAVDRKQGLYRIEWQDIKDGKYGKTLVKENVVHFYVDSRLGLATLNMDDTLSLPSDTVVDLKAKVDSDATWTIVTCIAECWIACGERERGLGIDGHAIMASVSRQADIRSTLKLKLTSNGYKNQYDGREFAGIYSMQKAFTRSRRGIMLAIERDGCCHLISVNYGRLSKLQSIDSIVNVDVVENEKCRIVMSVTATDTKGEFIAGGSNWTKRISLKLK